MRYIGNKTRLVPFVLGPLRRLGIAPGVACDPFAGTASVARALKRRGWRVHCGDLMACSYALQVAGVEVDHLSRLPAGLLDGGADGRRPIPLRDALGHLGALRPRHGFLTEHYTPAGGEGRRHGRMYFTPANAGALDAARERVAAWAAEGGIDRTTEQSLLAALIEAADRVANTTGVYASFVKSWQPNALRPLALRPVRPARGAAGCTAFLGPAEVLVERVGTVDLLYLDPPYNERQYPGYYHIPELIAAGWEPPPALRGKTGLIPDGDRRSGWCRRGSCEAALRDLLARADARHVLLSYNDEGILPAERIEEALRESGLPDTYRRFGRGYRRYRSDADGPDRRYARDRVREQLHYVRRA